MIQGIHILYFVMVLATGFAALVPLSVLPGPARTTWNLAMVVVASLVVALRDVNFGADTRVYLRIFEDPAQFDGDLEAAYMLALRTLGVITQDGTLFLFASSLAINFAIYAGCARLNARLAGLSFAFFTATPVFWLANVLVLRNGLGAALVALATIILVTSGRTRGFFAAVVTGALFHYSLLGHALLLAVGDLRSVRRVAISVATLAVAGGALVLMSSSFAAMAAPWVERYEDYQYYASTGQGAFRASSFEPQHAFPILIAFGAFLARRNLQPEEALLMRFYFVMVLMAVAFWGNVLFRDRLYLPAQMLEPLLFALLFRRLLDDKSFVLVSLLFLVAMGGVTVLLWGPRNVLQYY